MAIRCWPLPLNQVHLFIQYSFSLLFTHSIFKCFNVKWRNNNSWWDDSWKKVLDTKFGSGEVFPANRSRRVIQTNNSQDPAVSISQLPKQGCLEPHPHLAWWPNYDQNQARVNTSAATSKTSHYLALGLCCTSDSNEAFLGKRWSLFHDSFSNSGKSFSSVCNLIAVIVACWM